MPALIFIIGFFLYVYCEISLLVVMGSSIGVFPLILLMIAISIFGLWLIKLRGFFTLFEMRKQIAEGQIPAQAFVSSLFLVIAGILFIVPGLLSDILAILLLLPFTRAIVQAILFKVFSNRFHFSQFNASSRAQTKTFEAEFERKQDENRRIK